MSVRIVNGSIEQVYNNTNAHAKQASTNKVNIIDFSTTQGKYKALNEIYQKVAFDSKFSAPLTDLPHLRPEYDETPRKSQRAFTNNENFNYNTDYEYGLDSYISKDGKEDLTPNGKIDKDFKQGQIGDCWLLSSIQSIKDKKGGNEYLNSLLQYDKKTGNVKVNLKGIGKSYTITPEDLKANNDFSTGDADVRAIEVAIEKHLQNSNNAYKTIKNGAPAELAMKMLIGNGKSIGTPNTFQNYNSKNKAYTVSFNSSSQYKYSGASLYNMNTNSYTKLLNNHAYSISGSDDNNVYLKNPWGTNDLLKIDRISFESSNPFITSSFLPFK